MKTLWLFLLVPYLLLSCKKSENKISTPPQVENDTTYRMGLIHATPEELSKIRSIKELDTTLIRTFKSGLSVDEIIITGMPNANLQLFQDCVGWAIGYGMLGYHYRILYNNSTLTLSPTFIYNQLNGGQDNGISCPAALQLVKDKGTCKWSIMPGSTTSLTRQPSLEAIKDANDYTVSEYFKFDKDDFPQIKGYLRRNLPIVIDLDVDAAFEHKGYTKSKDYETEPDGNIVWRSTMSYKIIGAHAMVLCGYSDKLRAFLAFNSWGPTWGKNGYMWIDYDVFQKVVAEAYLAFPRYVTTTALKDGSLVDVKAEGNVRTYSLINLVSKGICYSADPAPTVEDTNDKKIYAAGKDGIFSVTLNDLKASTKYYVRAFAVSNMKIYYGNEQSFTTGKAQDSTVTVPRDGQVQIGSQVWMTKNLDVSTYRNGDPITQVTDIITLKTIKTGAWCYYRFDPTKGNIYGKMYNYYAVIDPRGLAPVGWHIPSYTEWKKLIQYLGPEFEGTKCGASGTINNVGEKLMEAGYSHWDNCQQCDYTANNSSGFTALPGGSFDPYRSQFGTDGFGDLADCGQFSEGVYTGWWNSNVGDYHSYYYIYTWYGAMLSVSNQLDRDTDRDGYMLYIRCMKD